KISPGAQEREETEEFPWDMLELLREEGLLYMSFPQKFGGQEAPLLQQCIAIEQICNSCNNTAVMLVYFANANFCLSRFSSQEQQNKYYSLLKKKGSLPTVVLTDASGGSDFGSIITRADLEGDHYAIHGVKRFISSADTASLFTIYAKTDPAAPKHRGISAFWADCKPGEETPGLSIRRERLMGMYSSDACEMSFSGFRIPKENLIGKENQGFKIAMGMVDYGRHLVASRGLGTAQGAFDCALNFAKERQAFGQPIGAFQGIQFMLADMATMIEATRQLLYMSAWHYDHGGTNTTLYASMSKLMAAEVAMKVTTDAVQILGGRGVTRDYPVQRLMKDAKIIQIVEGTSQIHRWIVGRRLTGT
ncbi:MAG: acyl-CoA dehydrogenase family protein, partial [Methanothrix sp.]|nr:acyl-CoA dehydrogenase family protein [Methanothrix sp.]